MAVSRAGQQGEHKPWARYHNRGDVSKSAFQGGEEMITTGEGM